MKGTSFSVEARDVVYKTQRRSELKIYHKYYYDKARASDARSTVECEKAEVQSQHGSELS